MVRNNNIALFLAWLIPSLALAIMFGCWAFVVSTIDSGKSPSLKAVLSLGIHGFEMGAVWQVSFGAPLYIALKKLYRINVWLIVVAYLIPALVFSLVASETYDDLIGTIPWIIYSVVMAILSWFFVSTPSRPAHPQAQNRGGATIIE